MTDEPLDDAHERLAAEFLLHQGEVALELGGVGAAVCPALPSP